MTRVVSVTPLPIRRDSRTFKQAASMARLGYDSVVFEGEPSQLGRDGLPFALESAPPEYQGVTEQDTTTVSTPSPLSNGRGARLRKSVKAQLEPLGFVAWLLIVCGWKTARRLPRAELYYLHSFGQFPAVWIRSKRDNVPFVYDAHDFYPESRSESAERNFGTWVVDRFLTGMERLCVRRAASVVTVGNGVADMMEEAFGRRPEIVRNCHDTRIDKPPARRLRETLELPDEAFLIVTAGNAKLGSATQQALTAMSRLPDHVHFAFVGAGYESIGADIERLGLGHRVHVVPPVAPTEVVPFISDADVAAVLYHALTPDYLHSLPNRFFSAIAAGLPILYPGQLPELSEIAEGHGMGLAIDPRSPTSIEEGVRRLVEDKGLMERLRQSVTQASPELSWEREERRLKEIIISALAR